MQSDTLPDPHLFLQSESQILIQMPEAGQLRFINPVMEKVGGFR